MKEFITSSDRDGVLVGNGKGMITVIELFAGIGSQTQALKNIGVEHKVVGISEIDKYAVTSYEAIHGAAHNFGDITKIERLPYADLWTYSFPCQDLSVAGLGGGIKQGTRSGLLLEVERLLETAKQDGVLPKYLLLENVKNLVGKQFRPDFDRWLKKLEQLGYRNAWQVLNAKDYEIPQNRERVFCLSVRNDIDSFYMFPQAVPLDDRLKDYLETEVAEKYYLSDTAVKGFLKHNLVHLEKGTGFIWQPKTGEDIASCIRANSALAPTDNTIKVNQVGNLIRESKFSNPHRGRIYSPDGLSPTLNTCGGGGLEPKVILRPRGFNKGCVKNGISPTITSSNVSKDNLGVLVYDDTYSSRKIRIYSKYAPTLRSQKQPLKVLLYDDYNSKVRADQDTIGTVTTNIGLGTLRNSYKLIERRQELRIRRLTPCECWRLMGFNDEAMYKAKQALNDTYYNGKDKSDSQLYKQAGNSIVVRVLEYIFRELFKE